MDIRSLTGCRNTVEVIAINHSDIVSKNASPDWPFLVISQWSWQIKLYSTRTGNSPSDQMIDLPDDSNIKLPIPTYQDKVDEPFDRRKARLLYQSRKRGMLENGILLSTFAAKYLEKMSLDHVQQYDRLINLPSNDWDIYYWAANLKETPPEYDNEIMNLLKEHVQNKNREVRIRQPDLYSAEPGEDLYRHVDKA